MTLSNWYGIIRLNTNDKINLTRVDLTRFIRIFITRDCNSHYNSHYWSLRMSVAVRHNRKGSNWKNTKEMSGRRLITKVRQKAYWINNDYWYLNSAWNILR